MQSKGRNNLPCLNYVAHCFRKDEIQLLVDINLNGSGQHLFTPNRFVEMLVSHLPGAAVKELRDGFEGATGRMLSIDLLKGPEAEQRWDVIQNRTSDQGHCMKAYPPALRKTGEMTRTREPLRRLQAALDCLGRSAATVRDSKLTQ